MLTIYSSRGFLKERGALAKAGTFSEGYPRPYVIISPLTQNYRSDTCIYPECIKAWTSESVTQALSVFILSLLPSIAFYLLAYIYYRQASDPQHPANLCLSGQSSAVRMDAYPEANYSPLYNRTPASYSDDIADALRIRPRTPKRGKKTKPSVDHLALPPMMQTASPYMMTPGPPSFGPSRDYRPGSGFFTVGSDGGLS